MRSIHPHKCHSNNRSLHTHTRTAKTRARAPFCVNPGWIRVDDRAPRRIERIAHGGVARRSLATAIVFQKIHTPGPRLVHGHGARAHAGGGLTRTQPGLHAYFDIKNVHEFTDVLFFGLPKNVSPQAPSSPPPGVLLCISKPSPGREGRRVLRLVARAAVVDFGAVQARAALLLAGVGVHAEFQACGHKKEQNLGPLFLLSCAPCRS